MFLVLHLVLLEFKWFSRDLNNDLSLFKRIKGTDVSSALLSLIVFNKPIYKITLQNGQFGSVSKIEFARLLNNYTPEKSLFGLK